MGLLVNCHFNLFIVVKNNHRLLCFIFFISYDLEKSINYVRISIDVTPGFGRVLCSSPFPAHTDTERTTVSQSQTIPRASTPQAEPQPLAVAKPRWWTLLIVTVIWSAVAYFFYRPSHGFVSWYTTIAWTSPFFIGIIGLYGAIISRPIIQRHLSATEVEGTISTPLDVNITTRGDAKVIGALTRVIKSAEAFAAHFENCTIRIVIEEDCEAFDRITNLAAAVGAQVVIVPKSYTTAKGTRFKARAQQYALEERVKELGGIDKIPFDHWTYHLDDDTSTCVRSVRTLATFIQNNRGTGALKHLAQGILAYKRWHSTSLFMWLADSIRTADDLFRFPATTATGTPRAGLHGENLLVRTRCEAEIGWDFGPNELVEDSRFALLFAERYPGGSAWVPVRCYGATPTSSMEFVRQRRRWSEGMMALALGGSLPFRERLLVLHNMIVWGTGVFQPVLVVFLLSALIGDFNVSPVTPWIAPLWVISVSYTYWAYWEGLRQNALASGRQAPTIWHRVLLIPGIVWFSFLEGLGGTLGALRHFSGREKTFDGIAKPV